MYIRLLFRAGIYSFCWKVQNFVIQYRVRVYFSVFFPLLEMFQSSKTVYFLRLFVGGEMCNGFVLGFWDSP